MSQLSRASIPAFEREDIKDSFALLLREALNAKITDKGRIARVAGVSEAQVTKWCSSPETLPGLETACRVIDYLGGWQRFICLLNNRDSSLEDNLALAEAALLGARARMAHHPSSAEREAALQRLGNLVRLAGEVIGQVAQGSTVADISERRVPKP